MKGLFVSFLISVRFFGILFHLCPIPLKSKQLPYYSMTLGWDRYVMNLDASIKMPLEKKKNPTVCMTTTTTTTSTTTTQTDQPLALDSVQTKHHRIGLIRATAGQPLFSASVLANQEQLAAVDRETACGGSLFPLRPRR